MKGVVLLAHGSREPETGRILEDVARMVGKRLPHMVLTTAFLQFDERSLERGLDALVEQGITQIAVIPYFLFSGFHLKSSIPRRIGEYAAVHPGVAISLGEPLGSDPRLAEIVADRAAEAQKRLEGRQ